MTIQSIPSRSPKTFVFIDATVGDRQTLINSVAPDSQVVILDSNRDGVAQITAALSATSNVTDLHIVSHGTPGCLYLGNTQLNLDSLPQYAPHLTAWNAALADQASILLYGCNVAAGDAGAEFVELLHGLTHAHIGASQTLTGNAALGGNWDLEVTTGAIAPLAFPTRALADYADVLTRATLGDASWEIEGDSSGETADIKSSKEGALDGLDRQVLLINNQSFDPFPFKDDQIGSVVTATKTINGLKVDLEYRVVTGINGEPVLRTFVTFTNPSTTAVANVSSLKLIDDIAGANLKVLGSSSGDNKFDTSDRFVITEATTKEGKNPGINTFAYFGSSNFSEAKILSGEPTTITNPIPIFSPPSVTLPGQPQALEAVYNNISVDPGASRSFMFFNSISETAEQARTEAVQFNDIDALSNNGLLTGLNSDQLRSIGIDTNSLGNLKIEPTNGSTTEAGGTASFKLTLSRKPTADVTVNFVTSDATEGTVDKASLTFTAANFNQPQTITVKGVDDTIVDGNIAYSIQTSFTSTDPFFSSNPADIFLTNTDNDAVSQPTPPPTPGPAPVFGKRIVGTPKPDSLIGTEGNDVLIGQSKSDRLLGNGGDDRLTGGSDNDRLFGGAGNDRLNGDRGRDTLVGGTGNDQFVLAVNQGSDSIQDYQDGQDKLDLTGRLSFGNITLTQKGSNTVISSGNAVLATLKGVSKTVLNASDFI